MIRNAIICLIFLSLFSFVIIGCDKPQVTDQDSLEIDVSQEPSQSKYTSDFKIIRKTKDYEFVITPVAEYKISAIVVGKKSYNDGWHSEIAPLDLVLAWGKLAETETNKYITFSQSNRWYFYEYKENCPFNNNYIATHSANNHIIPADENIFKAIKAIKKKEKVYLEGYLVNVSGSYRGRNFWWKSSLTRKDSGDGSCEVFYVKKVKIGTDVYE
ncbi:MAG: hypothetical protein ACPL1G_03390 [Thermodesulfovibrionales bacterium]